MYPLRILLLAVGLLSSWGLVAQETARYRDAHAHFKRGMDFYEQELFGKAREELDLAAQAAVSPLDTDLPEWQEQAQLYAGLSALFLERPDAEQRLTRFIKIHAPSRLATLAAFELADYYFKKRSYAQAIKYYNLIDANAMLSLSNKEIAKMKFQEGYAYFVRKEFRSAGLLFRELTELPGEYQAPANYYYGLTAYFQDDWNTALDYFERVSKSAQYSKVVPYYLCQLYFAREEYDKLIDYAKEALKRGRLDNEKEVKQLLGQAYFEKQAYQEALPYLAAYVKESSKVSREALYQLGFTQYQLKQYEAAISSFKDLNVLQNEMGQNALYNVGDCHLKLGNKKAARSSFQLASQLDADRSTKNDALINYAKLSYELGFDNDAINALRAVTITSTHYEEAQALLSKVFINTKDYKSALEILRSMEKTAKMQETYQKVAYFRGVQLFQAKQFAEAEQLFGESLTAGSHTETTALAHFWKAEGYYRRGAYDAAIKEYLKFASVAPNAPQLPANSSIGTANYGLGYSYLRKENYGLATDYFAKAAEYIRKKRRNINDDYVLRSVYPDALLRAGDGHLKERNYKSADKFYGVVGQQNLSGADYALYQQSVISSLQSDFSKQLRLLDQLIRKYPQSGHKDDAMFAMGMAYRKVNNSAEARNTFDRILSTYQPAESEFVNKALIQLGVLALAEGRDGQAIEYYKRAFSNNPQGESANDALALLQEAYIEMGDADGYFQFLESVPNYSISEGGQDTVLYKTALKRYRDSDFTGAILAYDKYISRFPSGSYLKKARFERANAHYELENYNDALADYAWLSENGMPGFAMLINKRAARITYSMLGDFEQAYVFFGRLRTVAEDEETRFTALEYQALSAYNIEKWEVLPPLAEAIYKDPLAANIDKANAQFFKGKGLLAQNLKAAAKSAFEKAIALEGRDDFMAEARYRIARITYQMGDLEKAEALFAQYNESMTSQLDWLARIFILSAEVDAAQGEYIQAKSTLNSLLQNYRGDEAILQDARQKLAEVERKEAEGSKLRRGGSSDELQMED